MSELEFIYRVAFNEPPLENDESFTLPPCQQYTRSSRPNRWAARCLACGI